MNRAQLIEALAEKSGLSKQKAKKVLESYMEIVTEKMSQNEEIALIGFGTLIPRPQSSRMARNPKTGTPVRIKARTTVKFKPGKFLLEAINGKKMCIRDRNNSLFLLFSNFQIQSEFHIYMSPYPSFPQTFHLPNILNNHYQRLL